MTTDLIYHSLRNAIIHSYQSGEMDNTMGQLKKSLEQLDTLYNPKLFHNGHIVDAKIRLLTKIQNRVDKIMGVKIYSDMWE